MRAASTVCVSKLAGEPKVHDVAKAVDTDRSNVSNIAKQGARSRLNVLAMFLLIGIVLVIQNGVLAQDTLQVAPEAIPLYDPLIPKSPIITSLNPTQIGAGGGIPLTLLGFHFPVDAETSMASNVNVTISGQQCPVNHYFANEGRIVCHPVPALRKEFTQGATLGFKFNLQDLPEYVAEVRLYVHGVQAIIQSSLFSPDSTDYFPFTYKPRNTPTIGGFGPQAVSKEGDTVTLLGRRFYDEDPVNSNIILWQNDTLAAQLTPTDSDKTHITGNNEEYAIRGMFLRRIPVGYYNATVVLYPHPLDLKQNTGTAATAGGTIPDQAALFSSVYQQRPDGQLYMLASYPTITRVSPQTLSLQGGVLLSVYGTGFKDNMNITIGDVECPIVSVTGTFATCTTVKVTPKWQPTSGTGLLRQKFVPVVPRGAITLRKLNVIVALTRPISTDHYLGNIEFHDKHRWGPTALNIQKTVTRLEGTQLSGFFTPPYDSDYTFYCDGNDFVEFKLSPTPGNSTEAVIQCDNTASVNDRFSMLQEVQQPQLAVSGPVTLKKGQYYNMTVLTGDLTGDHFFSVGVSHPVPASMNASLVFSTVPLLIQVKSDNVTGPMDLGFNSTRLRIRNLVSNGTCLSVAAELERIYLDSHVEEEIVGLNSQGTQCSWLLRIQRPKIMQKQFKLEGGTVTLIHDAKPTEMFYRSIPASMTRLASPNAGFPVTVTVDGMEAARAPDASVNVSFANTSTPTLTSAFPVQLFAGSQLTIRGSSLTSVQKAVVVFIGDPIDNIQCTNVRTFIDGATLLCDIPSTVVAGTYAVNVRVGEFGLAEYSSPLKIQVQLSVQSVTPNAGSIHGGANVTVVGSGFSSKETEVKIGGVDCEISRATSTMIICITPDRPDYVAPIINSTNTTQSNVTQANGTSTNATSGNTTNTTATSAPTAAPQENTLAAPIFEDYRRRRFRVVVSLQTKYGNTTFSDNAVVYTYDTYTTPNVTSVTPTSGPSTQSPVLTIVGEGLVGAFVVLCVPERCHRCLASSTGDLQILCHPRIVAPNNYTVLVVKPAWGYAASTVFYQAVFDITNVTPRHGTRRGGSLLEITGMGFEQNQDVFVGSVPCIPYQRVTGTGGTTTVKCRLKRIPDSVSFVGPQEVRVYPANRLYRDGYEARCGAGVGNCTFNITMPNTPLITSVKPKSGFLQMITLVGANMNVLDVTPEIYVGRSPCTINRRVLDTIQCTIQKVHAAGNAEITMQLKPYGFASSESPSVATYQFGIDVTSIFPTNGSTAGGQYVTIVGTGFDPVNATAVIVAGQPCTIDPTDTRTSINETLIVCETGQHPSPASHTGPVTVTGRNDVTATCCKYEYNEGLTPVLENVEPLSADTDGQVNFTGRGFSHYGPANVSFAGFIASNSTVASDSKIIAFAPLLPASRAIPKIRFGVGFARTTRVQKFVSFPIITHIKPSRIWVTGGETITIYGGHFGVLPTDIVRVTVCGRECPLVTSLVDRIECNPPSVINSAMLKLYKTHPAPSYVPLQPFATGQIATTAQIAALSDGDPATVLLEHRNTAGELSFGVDVGETSMMMVSRLEVFLVEYPEQFHDAVLDISIDGISWVFMQKLFKPTYGWNIIDLEKPDYAGRTGHATSAKKIRISPATTVNQVAVGEMRVLGWLANNTYACSVVVSVQSPKSDFVTTCTERPSRCIDSPKLLNYSYSETPRVGIWGEYHRAIGTPLAVNSIYFSPNIDAIATRVSNGNVKELRAAINVSLDGVPQGDAARGDAGVLIVTTTAMDFWAQDKTVLSLEENQRSMITFKLGQDIPTTTSTYTDQTPQMTYNGFALIDAPNFVYHLNWSSPTAWDGARHPTEGDVVHIPKGTSILLDEQPSELSLLVIEGRLVFDPTVDDIELRATHILVRDGGVLQAGTSWYSAVSTPPNQNFHKRLTITLTGDRLTSIPLPLYGSKVLAIDGGSVLLHGYRRRPYFTSLYKTANAGIDEITVVGASNPAWLVGDVIAISSSSYDHTETEIRTITFVQVQSSTTVYRFADPLQYSHVVETENVNLDTVTVGAHVALLTRSIRIQGDENSELDNFGCHLFSHSQHKNVKVDLNDVEFYRCGQEGDPFRFPVHFFHEGNMYGSKLTGIAVRHSYNRGIVLGGTSHVSITKSVVVDTVGHGIVLQEGSEQYNTISDNIVFLNYPNLAGDPLVSSYFITNPLNVFSNNIAAGTTHHGFWLAFPQNPRGISQSSATCTSQYKLLGFTGNEAHSNGLNGFNIYPQHYSRENPCGDADPILNPYTRNDITTFKAWRNKFFGMNFGEVGNYHMTGFTGIDNGVAHVDCGAVADAILIQKSIFIAHSQTNGWWSVQSGQVSVTGILTPRSEGLKVLNSTFVRYDELYSHDSSGQHLPHFAIHTCSHCHVPAMTEHVAFTTTMEAILFKNSRNRVNFGFPYVHIVHDVDGTFLSTSDRIYGPGATAVPQLGHFMGLPPCQDPQRFYSMSAGPHTAVVCNSSVAFHSLTVFGQSPSNVTAYNLTMSSIFGSTTIERRFSTFRSWSNGYTTIIPTGTYWINGVPIDLREALFQVKTDSAELQSTGNYTNEDFDWRAFKVMFSRITPTKSEVVHVGFKFYRDYIRGDVFTVSQILVPPTMLNTLLGDPPLPLTVLPVTYADPTIVGQYYAKDPRSFLDSTSRLLTLQMMASNASMPDDILEVRYVECPETGCLRVEPPVIPPTTSFWKDVSAWRIGRVPTANDDVVIPSGQTVILNSDARVRSLVVQGVLEFSTSSDLVLQAKFLVVHGGAILIGNETVSHPRKARIVMHDGPETMGVDDRIILNAGTFANFGRIAINGTSRGVPYTTLSQSAVAGDALIKTADQLAGWGEAEEFAIASTRYDYNKAEVLTIRSFEKDLRGINTVAPLVNDHTHFIQDVLTSIQLPMSAEVALLARDVSLEGANGGKCFVYLGEYGFDNSFTSRGVVANMAIRGCGSEGQGPAVLIERAVRGALKLFQTVIRDSSASALEVHNSSTVTVEKTVFVNSRGSTVVLKRSAGNTLRKNLVFGTNYSNTFLNQFNPTNLLLGGLQPSLSQTYQLCSYVAEDGVNILDGNIAAGSASEGFCYCAAKCGTSAKQAAASSQTVERNVAHSNVVGFFPTTCQDTFSVDVGSNDGKPCAEITNVRAWRNGYIGIHSVLDSDTVVNDVMVHDNHIGMSIMRVGAGTVKIENSTVGGRSQVYELEDNCVDFMCISSNVLTTDCLERSFRLQDARDATFGEIGIMMSQFTDTPKSSSYSRPLDLNLPEQKLNGRTAMDGSVHIKNIVLTNFRNGRETGICGGSTAVQTMPMAYDRIPVHYFTNITHENYIKEGVMYLDSPSAAWASPLQCGNRPCDGLDQLLIHDTDGTFMKQDLLPYLDGGEAKTVVGNYYAHAVTCAEEASWNARVCMADTYGEYHFKNLDGDAFDRLLSPMRIQDIDFLSEIIWANQPPDCYGVVCPNPSFRRPSDMVFSALTGKNLIVNFAGLAPRHSIWGLRYCKEGGTPQKSIIKVLYDEDFPLSVWIPGQKEPVPQSPIQLSLTVNTHGQSFYEQKDGRLAIMLECGKSVAVHQLVEARIAMRLAVQLEDFHVNHMSTFLDVLAAFFQISVTRLRFRDVHPGSTVYHFSIQSRDTQNYNATREADDVNALVLKMVSMDPMALEALIGVPVLGFDRVTWAEGTPKPVVVVRKSTTLSTTVVVVICCGAFVGIIIIMLFIRKLYRQIMSYKEAGEEAPVDKDVAFPDFQQPAAPALFEEEAAGGGVDLGLKSLKIKVEGSDGEDDSDDDSEVANDDDGFGGPSGFQFGGGHDEDDDY